MHEEVAGAVVEVEATPSATRRTHVVDHVALDEDAVIRSVDVHTAPPSVSPYSPAVPRLCSTFLRIVVPAQLPWQSTLTAPLCRPRVTSQCSTTAPGASSSSTPAAPSSTPPYERTTVSEMATRDDRITSIPLLPSSSKVPRRTTA